jgi:hypothetical protein
MKAEATPGPWTYELKLLSDGMYNGKHVNPRTIEDYYSVEAGERYWNPKDNSKGFALTGYMSEVNARLIAAAPDLLEALEESFAQMLPEENPDLYAKMKSAINKARGL